ncbi:putative tight adherance operon protein [Yersinia frederiksenii]|uniref:TadE-like family protein n=2 Tax=Yersinia frederiksenii TaxID=29484 RepID=A0ABR4W7V9_YERFR|nr:TadE/TadG family type IV pilus assembly protein [Yersinia frederiksenii]KGA48793.1 tadE-like family protein [Yersinia frederiksenii ATCC 33641]SUP77049.1 putative tight adherance operon protein [Yersinia frederiksenii]
MYSNKLVLIIRERVKSDSGAISLEFALLIGPFLLLVFLFLEICRVIFISAALDLAVAESGREASFDSRASINYRTSFIHSLENNSQLWPWLGNSDAITIEDVLYCRTVEELVANNCLASTPASGAKLAVYSIKYQYSPVLAQLFFLSSFKDSLLSRKVVYVQHYELA